MRANSGIFLTPAFLIERLLTGFLTLAQAKTCEYELELLVLLLDNRQIGKKLGRTDLCTPESKVFFEDYDEPPVTEGYLTMLPEVKGEER